MKQANIKNKKTKKGFSLMETLIALFIFSMASVLLSGSFAGLLRTYASAKQNQKSAESAQFAMNLMAKTIRNSTVDPVFVGGASSLTIFDNSTATCFIYKYDTGVLKMASAKDATITGITKCNTTDAPSLADDKFTDLTKAGEITRVLFAGAPTTVATGIGKIIISIGVQGNISSQIQTTVSLRQ